MALSGYCKKLVTVILLFTAFTALFLGVLHELESDCCQENSVDSIMVADHADGCHSHHQSCSSLSCSHGTLFIAGTDFCWQIFNLVEKFSFGAEIICKPIVCVDFFKPPITAAG